MTDQPCTMRVTLEFEMDSHRYPEAKIIDTYRRPARIQSDDRYGGDEVDPYYGVTKDLRLVGISRLPTHLRSE